MASIRKRGEKWCVRWRGLDGRQHERPCHTAEAARTLAKEIDRARDIGREWEPAGARRRDRLGEVAIAYQDARRLRCRASTLRNEGAQLDVFLRFVGERKVAFLDELTRPLLDDFLAWLLVPATGRHGRQRAAGSASRTVGAALGLWRWAEDSGRYEDVPRAPHAMDLPRSAPPPVVAPTWAEMDAAVLACRGWQRQLATWLRYTGLRAGESMLVEWRDVDMAAGTLTIRPEIDKMGVGRTVPLHPALLDEIATWGRREGYVIPTRRHRDAKHHRDPRARDLRRAWIRSGARPELYERRPEHAFRRGFKSGLLQLGAVPDAVDYLQGHKLGEGSRGRYIAPWALPLAATLALVPVISAPSESAVVPISRGRGVGK